MSEFEAAELGRDRRLRKRILQVLAAALPFGDGDFLGRAIVDQVNIIGSEQIESDQHAMGLLRQLVAKGLIAERDVRRLRGQIKGLDWLRYRITDAGSRLLNKSAPPDPDVEDDRISQEEI